MKEEEKTDTRLDRRLRSIEKAIKEKAKRQKDKPQEREIVQLPLWPEPARGAPNCTLRGALFAAIQGKDRRYMKREVLAVQKGIAIRFTGMQLDQADLDVWEQALHLARLHPLGTRCDFTANAFLKSIGRSTGKAQHEWLKDVFARLNGCGVEISTGRFDYAGDALLKYWRDNDTGYYRIEFNPQLISLFEAGWTAIDWEQRQKIGRRKPLALWLHGFYASHAKPYPMKVETFRALSGSTNKQLSDFRRQLDAAHKVLLSVGAIDDYEIKDGLVSVGRTPSKSQKKHLNKPKPRKK